MSLQGIATYLESLCSFRCGLSYISIGQSYNTDNSRPCLIHDWQSNIDGTSDGEQSDILVKVCIKVHWSICACYAACKLGWKLW